MSELVISGLVRIVSDMEVAVVEIDRVADEGLVADARPVGAGAVRLRTDPNIPTQALIVVANCAGVPVAGRIHSGIGPDPWARRRTNRNWRSDGDSGLSVNVRLIE